MERKDFQNEMEYFNRVEGIIRSKLEKLYEDSPLLRERVRQERKEMWEDNRHLIRDFDDVVFLNTQEAIVNLAEKQVEWNSLEIQRLTKMEKSPYFGRVDFEDSLTGEADSVYIGIYSLVKEESQDIVVVDWRAPISSMFYQFDVGPAWYQVRDYRNEVEITGKRQYKIEDGHFLSMYDTDSSMYDDILGEVLSKHADHSLKVIIGSIQKEQNQAIRCDTKRSCLIYGLAGSGKTSIGLHRLAYVLYCNRDTIKSENILILSNNSIFASYISTILPDLGEKPAQTRVFADLLEASMERGMEIEDYYSQLKAMESGFSEERIKWMKIKYSAGLLQYCIDYFASFPFRIPEIRYRGDIAASAQGVQESSQEMQTSPQGMQVTRQDMQVALQETQESSQEKLVSSQEKQVSLQEKLVSSQKKQVPPQEKQESSQETQVSPQETLVSPDLILTKLNAGHFQDFQSRYERLKFLVRKSIEDFFVLHKEEICDEILENREDVLSVQEARLLYKKMMNEYIQSALEEIKRMNKLEPGKQMLEVFTNYLSRAGRGDEKTGQGDGKAGREDRKARQGDEGAARCSQETVRADDEALKLSCSLERGRLLYEDAILYLLIKVLMGKVAPFPDIYHTVIDESQDYSLPQLYIMKRLFPRSTFTLLGDIYQTVNSVTTIQQYTDYESIFGEGLIQIRLRKCYRSSSDINALAFRLIEREGQPVTESYSYFKRAVRKPQYVVSRDRFSCLVPILERLEQYRSVAVIVNSDEEALAVKSFLEKEKEKEAQLIISPEDEMRDRLVILPLFLAKGLEFDAVVLFGCIEANERNPHFRRKVYLGCTRALHELYFVEGKALPDSLKDCAPYMEMADRSGEELIFSEK